MRALPSHFVILEEHDPMKPKASRLFAVLALALVALIALMGATSKTATLQPDKLIILSTTDVKGHLTPCG